MLTGIVPFPAEDKSHLIKLIESKGIRGLMPQRIGLKSK
jgi:hypothetical protein